MNTKILTPSLLLTEKLIGYWVSQAIIAAAYLGLADHLDNKPITIIELAQKLNLHEESLYRLMRALSSHGIFFEETSRHFRMTELAEPLRSDHPQSIRNLCQLHGLPFHWQSWGELTECIKTGNSSLSHRFGNTLFEYLRENPKESEIFDRAMGDWTSQSNETIARGFAFQNYPSILDIGGGIGTFIRTILKLYPSIQGAVFDQAHVRPTQEEGIRFIEGDFFESIPADFHLYILKNILHDWNNEDALILLQTLRKAMAPQSRLLIIETLVPQGNSHHFSKWMDLEMLTMTKGGKERSIEDFKILADRAHFQIEHVYQFTCLDAVVEMSPLTPA